MAQRARLVVVGIMEEAAICHLCQGAPLCHGLQRPSSRDQPHSTTYYARAHNYIISKCGAIRKRTTFCFARGFHDQCHGALNATVAGRPVRSTTWDCGTVQRNQPRKAQATYDQIPSPPGRLRSTKSLRGHLATTRTPLRNYSKTRAATCISNSEKQHTHTIHR